MKSQIIKLQCKIFINYNICLVIRFDGIWKFSTFANFKLRNALQFTWKSILSHELIRFNFNDETDDIRIL